MITQLFCPSSVSSFSFIEWIHIQCYLKSWIINRNCYENEKRSSAHTFQVTNRISPHSIFFFLFFSSLLLFSQSVIRINIGVGMYVYIEHISSTKARRPMKIKASNFIIVTYTHKKRRTARRRLDSSIQDEQQKKKNFLGKTAETRET